MLCMEHTISLICHLSKVDRWLLGRCMQPSVSPPPPPCIIPLPTSSFPPSLSSNHSYHGHPFVAIYMGLHARGPLAMAMSQSSMVRVIPPSETWTIPLDPIP